MAIARKRKPTKEVEETEEEDLETGEEEELETETEDAGEETETDDEESDDEESDDEESEEEEETLPRYDAPLGEPEEGFDFLDTVHADLKEAGYVTNKKETKDIVGLIHNLMFFDAFENGEHRIPGLGTISSSVKEASTRVANFDMSNGTKKGEEYNIASKHVISFSVLPAAKNKLAEISELEGWSPEDFLEEEEETEE